MKTLSFIYALSLLLFVAYADEKNREQPAVPAVGAAANVGCGASPKKVQRLRINESGIYENFLVDGKWIDSTLVKIKADDVVLRHCEIKNGLGNGVYVDTNNVLIDSCKIHHLLRGTYENQIDAHGITGQPTNLTIRNCEIYLVSGDGIQFDPNRLPWGNVLVENCTIWTGPLLQDAAGFMKDQRPGENAVDTKQNNEHPRSKITFRNCLMYGWKQPGQIGNMAAFNIKNKVRAVIEGCVFRDNEISLRLRGGSGAYNGALVSVKDCAIYSSDIGVRIEDSIQNLKMSHIAFGQGVTRKYQMAGDGVGSGYENTGEHRAPSYPQVLEKGVRSLRLQVKSDNQGADE